ncbi:choline ABC transporter substrate-binding protein [Vibrio tritonius]|uniref:choline ABC transporter substrate-binding protein n=1 Tax=Vibrio tritonius TaxID=1435069 RepID=UPI00315D4D82
MRKLLNKSLLLLLCFMPIFSSYALERVPQQCKDIKFAEIGWADLAFTTSVARLLLDNIGYHTSSDILSINVALVAMNNNKVDTMLGYWEPAMNKYIVKYLDKGTIDVVKTNLTEAKYTYAVPSYVYDAGVKDIRDIHKFPKKFHKRLYGIEPGSNGAIIKAVDQDKYQLGGWKVVESSEQGMLAQVSRAVRKHEWIAFLAWEPHPMNTKFDIRYLTGADDIFGPNFGSATVHTITRQGFTSECSNAGRLLKNLSFNVEMENEGMKYILEDKNTASEAAYKIIKSNLNVLDKWLSGVNTVDGNSALLAIKKKFEDGEIVR